MAGSRHFVLLSMLALFAIGAPAQGQQAKSEFQPRVGQAGKDVVWVPTPQALVDMMLDMAKATPSDYVMDLGSGDPNGDYRGEARHSRPRHRIQSRHGGVVQAQCRQRRGER
jgi:hypothetical protein